MHPWPPRMNLTSMRRFRFLPLARLHSPMQTRRTATRSFLTMCRCAACGRDSESHWQVSPSRHSNISIRASAGETALTREERTN